MDPTTPTDEEVISALESLTLMIIKKGYPDLARLKVLALLKTEHNWALSDARLKKIMAAYGLRSPLSQNWDNAIDQSTLPPPVLPADAFAAQKKYKEESIRCFKIYGRGNYDYGVTPNSDMQILIAVRAKNH